MNETVQLHDKTFRKLITRQEIMVQTKRVASEINRDFQGKRPLFLSVLNGACRFTADLMKDLNVDSEFSFIKVASYEGTESTGAPKILIGLNEALDNREVVIIEDIVETGVTIKMLIDLLQKYQLKALKIATCFLKPAVNNKNIPVDYVAFKIPDHFIAGYGLDYNGLGRNLNDVYELQ